MTRAAFLTSLKITLIYAAGFALCRYVLVKLPDCFQVFIAMAYFGGAMF